MLLFSLFSSGPWGVFCFVFPGLLCLVQRIPFWLKLVFRLKPALGPGGDPWNMQRPPESSGEHLLPTASQRR